MKKEKIFNVFFNNFHTIKYFFIKRQTYSAYFRLYLNRTFSLLHKTLSLICVAKEDVYNIQISLNFIVPSCFHPGFCYVMLSSSPLSLFTSLVIKMYGSSSCIFRNVY